MCYQSMSNLCKSIIQQEAIPQEVKQGAPGSMLLRNKCQIKENFQKNLNVWKHDKHFKYA